MYILKNAWIHITRSKSRVFLIGFLMMVTMISACIALTIYHSSQNLIGVYQAYHPLKVEFRFDSMNFRQDQDTLFSTISMKEEDVEKYADSSYVKDFYYTSEISVFSNEIDAIDFSDLFMKPENGEKNHSKFLNDEKKMNHQEYFRLVAYSDFSYMQEFIDGNYKMVEGSISNLDSSEFVIIIHQDLAQENGLSLGDFIPFYLTSDSDTFYSFKIVGIFDGSLENSSIYRGSMNEQNQMYTNIDSIKKLIESNGKSSQK